VPAAAVIPAVIAYFKVVAVKTLVVGLQDVVGLVRVSARTDSPVLAMGHSPLRLTEWR